MSDSTYKTMLISIRRDLHYQLKVAAAVNKTTMTALIERGIQSVLAEPPDQKEQEGDVHPH